MLLCTTGCCEILCCEGDVCPVGDTDTETDTSSGGTDGGTSTSGGQNNCSVHCFKVFVGTYSVPQVAVGGIVEFPPGTSCQSGLNSIDLSGQSAFIDGASIDPVCPIMNQADAEYVAEWAVCQGFSPPDANSNATWSYFVSSFLNGPLLNACVQEMSDSFGCDEATDVCTTYLLQPLANKFLTPNTDIDNFIDAGSTGANVPWTCDFSNLVCQ